MPGSPSAIGANYVRSRTKRISWSNDIVRDSFFSLVEAATLAILCRCNLLQLTKGGTTLTTAARAVTATTHKKSGECESRSSGTRQNTTVFLPFQSQSLIRVNTVKLGFRMYLIQNSDLWIMYHKWKNCTICNLDAQFRSKSWLLIKYPIIYF